MGLRLLALLISLPACNEYVCLYVTAAYNDTLLDVDWLASDVVTSHAVFTLTEGQFVDLNASKNASTCVYLNSSDAVLVTQLSRLMSGSAVSVVPPLARLSSNYTFVSYRRQFDDDSHLQHYLQVQCYFHC